MREQNRMNVALPAELEKRVGESVERGEFATWDEFFKQAAELLLDVRGGDGSPLPVDDGWENRIEALTEEAQASGGPREMARHDWDNVERQARALLRARNKA